jgi:hypothetical protein
MKPYDRLHNETSRPYDAFVKYLELGPQRSQRKVAEAIGKSTTIVCRWATKYNWRERALAYDDDIAKIRIDRSIETRVNA